MIQVVMAVQPNDLDVMISKHYHPLDCSLTHIGECAYPAEPIVGWVCVFIIAFIIHRALRSQ